MDDPFFADPGWVDVAVAAPPDSPMDLSLHPHGPERLLAWAEAWCRQHFTWVDISDGPGERPLICPGERYAYRLCARLPPYPQGVWVHVVVTRAFALVTVRSDPQPGDTA